MQTLLALLLLLPPPEARPAESRPAEIAAELDGHRRAVAGLAFSPDGKLLASVAWDNRLCLWKQGAAEPWVKLPGSPSGLAFLDGGKTLAAGGMGNGVVLWDLTGKEPTHKTSLPGHKFRPFALAFEPHGKLLVSGSLDPVLRLWKWSDEPEAWGVLANDNVPSLGISALAFSHDGKLLVAGGRGERNTLRLWKIGDYLEEIDIPRANANVAAFSPKDRMLAFAAGDAAISQWNVEDPARPTVVGKLAGHDGGCLALAMAPDGKSLASSGKDKKVMVWNLGSRQKIREWTLVEEVKALAWSPDGSLLALGNADGSIYLVRIGSRSPSAPR